MILACDPAFAVCRPRADSSGQPVAFPMLTRAIPMTSRTSELEQACSCVELSLFHKYVMGTHKVQLAMHSAASGAHGGIFIVATSDLRQSISRGGVQYVVHVTFDRGAMEAMLEVIEDGLARYFPWAATRKSDDVREALGSYDFADVPTLSDVDAVAGDMALADAVMREAEAAGGNVANCICIMVCAAENHNCSKGGVDNISAFLKDIGISLPQLLQVGGVLHVKGVFCLAINARSIRRAALVARAGSETLETALTSKKMFRQTWSNADKGDTLRNDLRLAIAKGSVFRGRDEAYDEFIRQVTAPAAGDLPKPPFVMTPMLDRMKMRGRRSAMHQWLLSVDGSDGPRARAGAFSLREVSEDVHGKGMCYVCGRRNVRTVSHECSIIGGLEDDGRYKVPVWVCAMGVANDITTTSGCRRTCLEVLGDPHVSLDNIDVFRHQSKPQNNPSRSAAAPQLLPLFGLATTTPRATPQSTPMPTPQSASPSSWSTPVTTPTAVGVVQRGPGAPSSWSTPNARQTRSMARSESLSDDRPTKRRRRREDQLLSG